jgi:glycosyltransferase involved in cell wall biosynthesis
MQEIKKRRIVIVSVLKPVDDTRMFEKFALTLAEFHEVHIIGFPAVRLPDALNITFHPTKPFTRLSFNRLITPWKSLRTIIKLRPHDLIITTHELLFPCLLLKLFYPVRIWYDVQENYYRNILFTRAFPMLIRPVLASYVRLKEILFAPLVEGFFLAEKTYQEELGFVRKKGIVLENKAKPADVSGSLSNKSVDGMIRLLFSGTLAESTGIFHAIRLAEGLHAVEPAIQLYIVGHCARKTELNKIRSAIRDKNFIHLVGGDVLVPHHEIVAYAGFCNFGIIANPVSPANAGRIPTKLYEYLSYRLPILCTDHPSWTSIINQFNAGLAFDPLNTDYAALCQNMRSTTFYTLHPTGIHWSEEAPRLLACFK